MTEELKVIISASTDGFKKGVQEAEHTLKSFAAAPAKFAKDFTKSFVKTTAAFATASATMVGAIAKGSLDAYANYEQLVGGVDTLFKDSSAQLQTYAANAYKNQQMSANQYMEMATSFSASLIQSLGGDTTLAAKYADMAITDMADNANKMGTSIESVQNAYRGFARGSYAMLDNLKLGYGGTRQEMERLLSDAEKLTGVKYDINNLNDVFDAIHAIQTELGITGTSAEEAMKTIQGSAAMTKAAWQNLLTAFADESADITKAVSNLSESTIALVGNVGNRVAQIFPAIADGLGQFISETAGTLVGMIESIAPKFISSVSGLASVIASTLPQIAAIVAELAPQIIESFVSIMSSLGEAFSGAIDAIIANLPAILGALAVALVSCSGIIGDAMISLLQGITTALPMAFEALIPQIPALITNLATTLASFVGVILTGATTLFQGIADALPTVIASVCAVLPDLVNSIVSFLVSNVGLIISAAITLFSGIIDAMPTIIATVVGLLPELITNICNGIASGVGSIISGFIQLFLGFVQALPTIISTIVSNLPAIISAIISGLLSNIGALVAGFVQLFVAFIIAIPQIIVSLVAAMPQIIEGIVQGLLQGIGALFEAAAGLGKAIWEGIKSIFTGGTPGTEIAEQTATDISNGQASTYAAGQSLGTACNNGIASTQGKIYDTSYMIGDTVHQGIADNAEPIIAEVDNIGSGVNASLQASSNEAQGIVGELNTNVSSEISSMSTDVGNSTTDMGTNMVDNLNTVASEIEAPLSSIDSAIKSTFGKMEKTVSQTVDKVVSAVEKMVSKLLDSVNFTWNLPHLAIPHLSVSGRFNTNPPSVPRYSIAWYARGGVFDVPTLFSYGNGALGGLGEHGAEAVVPLENNTEWLDKIAERLAAGMGGSNAPVVLQVDGKTFAEISVDSINALTRQRGSLGINLV